MVVRVGSWWRGRKKRHTGFSSGWLWIMVAVVLTEMVSGERETIYPGTQYCPRTNANTTIICNLTHQHQEYLMEVNTDMKYNKVEINSANMQVAIRERACSTNIEKIEIHHASKVNIEDNDGHGDNCSLQLVLHNSRGANIVRGVDLIRMEFSEAHKVNLPRVSQLDLKNSTVGEVSVTVDGQMSTIHDSEIKVVTKLAVNGKFVFEVKRSKLGRVKKFFYNADPSNHNVLEDVDIGSVSHGGFIVNTGDLTLRNCTIKRVESRGIVVNTGAKLTIDNSRIITTLQDSIYVKKDSFLSLKNVAVHQMEIKTSFALSDTSAPMFPLKLLYGVSPPSTTWITVGVFFGLVVGGLTGVGIMCYLMKRRRYMNSEVETNKLLSLEHFPPQTDLGPAANKHNIQSIRPLQSPASRPFPGPPNHPLPGVPNRPLPEVPVPLQSTAKNTANRPLPDVPNGTLQKTGNRPQPGVNGGEEEYEEYSDVVSGLDRNALQTAMAHGSSIPLGLKDDALPFSPQRSATASKDERDALPPPPPPEEEELYDEVEPGSSIKPPPPPSGNKPAPPPSGNKPAPPPSGNKPAPPPSGNKPSSRKPDPPPAAGKPKKP